MRKETKADPPAPGLEPGAPSAASSMMTALDIQQKEFRVSRIGGYRMRDVDEFLDRLTDTMSALTAENERLRRGVGGAPIVGTPDLDEVSRQADEIIARARDEAARITAEANERAAGAAGIAATSGATSADQRAAVGAFLAQERAFLQSLAALVQEHADTVKGMARRTRPEATSTGGSVGPEVKAPQVKAPQVKAPEVKAPEVKTPTPPASKPDPATSRPAPSSAPSPRRDQAPTPASDDTQVIDRDEPIVVDEPQPAATRRDERENQGGDPSLRELFWGEDA